tara:strand:+ start:62 stop:463 length:402 start_codon:yes stop_codon:yes gene_type:complete
MKVEVYWNITKKCWSIRDAKTKKVVEHLRQLVLTDVTFVVQPAGNARVRREKRKNVHAWAKGTLIDYYAGSWPRWEEVTYNPYKHTSFVFVNRPAVVAPWSSPQETWLMSQQVKGATKALFRKNGTVHVQGGE